MATRDNELDGYIMMALQTSVTQRQKEAAWERLCRTTEAQVLIAPLQVLPKQSQALPSPLSLFLRQVLNFLLVETMYQRAAANREAVPLNHFFSSQIIVQFYPFHPLQLRAY